MSEETMNKIKVTIELSDEDLRVLREIVLYCGDSKDVRIISVTKLYNHYGVSGGTISTLLSEAVIETIPRSFIGDELSKFDVRPTSLGREVIKSADMMLKRKKAENPAGSRASGVFGVRR